MIDLQGALYFLRVFLEIASREVELSLRSHIFYQSY